MSVRSYTHESGTQDDLPASPPKWKGIDDNARFLGDANRRDCQLRLNDIDLTKDPPRVTIKGEYTKTGNSRIAFISSEAKEILLKWLKNRDAYMVRAVARSGHHEKNTNNDRIFPFDSIIANVQLTEAFSKSGLLESDSSTKRVTIHPHVLRKFFRTRMGAVIPVDVTEALMGHEGYLTEVYRKYTNEELADFYRKGEPSLMIFSDGEQMTRLRDEIEEKNKQLQTLINGLASENFELKQRLSKIESDMSRMAKAISTTTI